MTTEVSTTAGLFATEKTAVVNMNDVVNVFVSKYEENLIAEQEMLNSSLAAAKKECDEYIASLKTKYNELKTDAKYNYEIEEHGLVGTCSDIKIDAIEHQVSIHVEVRDAADDPKRCHSCLRKIFTVDFTADEKTEIARLQNEITRISTSLATVLKNIRDIGRKERQIRAKISEKQLAAAGYSELIADTELLQLTQL